MAPNNEAAATMPSSYQKESPNGNDSERRPTEEHSLLEMQGTSHSEREFLDDLLRKRRRKRLFAILSIAFVVCLVTFMLIVAVRAIFFSEPPIPVTVEDQMSSLNGRKTIASVGCTSTVILMRHCEKVGDGHVDDDGDQHCSEIGYKRAEYIATLFGDDDSSRWPTPVKLYAMGRRRPFVRHSNYREIETLTPLARRSNLKVDARFTAEHERDLAEDYFDALVTGGANEEFCGGVTIVNWKHSRMHAMAVALGCGPEQGCPAKYKSRDFDKVWVIRYRYHGEEPTGEEDGFEVESSQGQRGLKKHKPIVYGWTVNGKVSKEHFQIEGTNSTTNTN